MTQKDTAHKEKREARTSSGLVQFLFGRRLLAIENVVKKLGFIKHHGDLHIEPSLLTAVLNE